jgi:hypothetical protein
MAAGETPPPGGERMGMLAEGFAGIDGSLEDLDGAAEEVFAG